MRERTVIAILELRTNLRLKALRGKENWQGYAEMARRRLAEKQETFA